MRKPMKILALGGSGGMGRFVVRSLINHEKIRKIFIADINASSAKTFASNFDNRVEGLELDITNNEALINEMSKVDIVVNTTGPFFKFGLPILKAAIDTNTHYFDICDDWEPTEKMLLLNNDDRSSEITGIIGLGASPGLTNILAYLAILELDEVSKVYTGWNISGAKPEDKSSQKGVNAAMVHGIQQVTGYVKVFNNGKYEMVRPLKEVMVNYPEIGEKKANIFGHPEAVSFPYHYPNIKESLNLMHGGEKGLVGILKFIRLLIEIKLISKNMAARIFTWLDNSPSSETKKTDLINLPGVYGYVEGKKGNKNFSVGVTFDDSIQNLSMGEATSLPLACGVKMFLDGVITQKGIHAPESGIIDPKIFIDYLAKEIGSGIQLSPLITINEDNDF
jgi:saccharopine dehydrogenase-like NADP-dependent oxidoreductase